MSSILAQCCQFCLSILCNILTWIYHVSLNASSTLQEIESEDDRLMLMLMRSMSMKQKMLSLLNQLWRMLQLHLHHPKILKDNFPRRNWRKKNLLNLMLFWLSWALGHQTIPLKMNPMVSSNTCCSLSPKNFPSGIIPWKLNKLNLVVLMPYRLAMLAQDLPLPLWWYWIFCCR